MVPPEAPTTKVTLPDASTTMVGQLEERGLFPGKIKLFGDGGKPKKLMSPGTEKSSITLFRMIPVDSDVNPAPKLK